MSFITIKFRLRFTFRLNTCTANTWIITQLVIHWQCILSSEQLLPSGWDKRLDATKGRYYYVNHKTKITQWERPSEPRPKEELPSGNPLLIPRP